MRITGKCENCGEHEFEDKKFTLICDKCGKSISITKKQARTCKFGPCKSCGSNSFTDELLIAERKKE